MSDIRSDLPKFIPQYLFRIAAVISVPPEEALILNNKAEAADGITIAKKD